MSLRKQTAVNSIGSIVLLGCQWLISIFLVRFSGFEDAGVFALAMSISNVFATFVNFGIRSYQVTDIGYRYSPNQYIAARLPLSALTSLACVLYLRIDSYSARNAAAILLYLSYNITFYISDILMGNLQREGYLELNGYSNSIRGVICLILFCFTQLVTGRLLASMGAMSLGSLLVLLCFDIPVYRRNCIKRGLLPENALASSLSIYGTCFFILISTIIPIVITAIPRRVIQRVLGDAMLGVFSSVYTPVVIMNTLIPAIILAIVPGMTRLWREGERQKLTEVVHKCYAMVFSITLMAYALSVLAGKGFLRIAYGAEITPYAPLLQMAVIATGLNCACVSGSYILIAMERRWQMALFSFVSLTVMLFSRYFVCKYELYGAAYVLIMAYGAQALLQLATIISAQKERKV